jgi:hypothetical protein
LFAWLQIGIPGDNAQLTLPLQDLVFNQKKVVGSIVGGRSGAANGISSLMRRHCSLVAGADYCCLKTLGTRLEVKST